MSDWKEKRTKRVAEELGISKDLVKKYHRKKFKYFPGWNEDAMYRIISPSGVDETAFSTEKR